MRVERTVWQWLISKPTLIAIGQILVAVLAVALLLYFGGKTIDFKMSNILGPGGLK